MCADSCHGGVCDTSSLSVTSVFFFLSFAPLPPFTSPNLLPLLLRHPWTFIVRKGDPSSAVEDHAVYQGRNPSWWISKSLVSLSSVFMFLCCQGPRPPPRPAALVFSSRVTGSISPSPPAASGSKVRSKTHDLQTSFTFSPHLSFT